MAYTTINKSTDYYNTKIYTGTGAEHAITGVGFQPDFVWTKRRNSTGDHHVHDVIRGATYKLQTNDAGVNNSDAQTLKSFDSDGFTLGTNTSSNASGGTYVSWNFLGANGTASNTDGTITSTVSANTTSGFSIVKYTGNLTSGATIGHGLGAKPAMMIIKNLAASESWLCYHTSLGATKHIKLNATEPAGTATSRFNDTEPTTSVFTVGNDPQTNGNSNDMIAYCFAEKAGFSKMGFYTGNGNADGSFVYTGFKPAFLLYKCSSDNFTNWQIHDSARSTYNVSVNRLNPNDNSAEVSTTNDSFDLLSNGFKARGTATNSNNSGSTFIYMAFAKAPLVGTNNIPATAR